MDLKKKFPNASASFLKLNGQIEVAPERVTFRPDGPGIGVVYTDKTEQALKAFLSLANSTDEQKLNKTEKAYLGTLRNLFYPWIGIQCITLKLADDTRLTPDFVYLDQSGQLTFVDVKGFQREDALIKMKVAARLFRWARFEIVKKTKDGWDRKEVKP